MNKRIMVAILLSLIGSNIWSQQREKIENGEYIADWESLEKYQTPEWFKDAKFGIWAHWGPQCQPGDGDWYARHMYYEGTGQFKFHKEHYGNPEEFGFKDVINDWKAESWNPEQLMKLYKQTGAKYFVALANHHDNFDLWDSPYQEWNSTRVGPKRNILAEWGKAAKKQKLPFGISFHASHAWSWLEGSQDYDGKLTKSDGKGTWWEGLDPQELYAQNHPHSEGYEKINAIHSQWTWGNGVCEPSKVYIDKFFNRTIDAINKFNPDVVYFDDVVLPFYPYDEKVGLEIAAHLYNHNAKHHKGKQKAVLLAKDMKEQHKKCLTWDVERGVPAEMQKEYWQTCTCIGQWHYDYNTYRNNKYKSAATIVYMLTDIISKNGNLLLSVPLRGDGSLDEKELSILNELGQWMKINGESIYGTRPWIKFGEGPTSENAKPVKGIGFNEGIQYSSKDIRFVTKGDVLYATSLGWPDEKRIVINSLAKGSQNLKKEISSVKLLGHGKVPFRQTEEGLIVSLPDIPTNTIAPVLKIK